MTWLLKRQEIFDHRIMGENKRYPLIGNASDEISSFARDKIRSSGRAATRRGSEAATADIVPSAAATDTVAVDDGEEDDADSGGASSITCARMTMFSWKGAKPAMVQST